jgi:DNA-binding NarL/FixJ family response regulator
MSPPVRGHRRRPPDVPLRLRAVLDAAEEVTVVGEAADGQQLLAVVDQTQPDVLTDLAARPDGATATRRCWTATPAWGARLTMHDDDQALLAAPRRSARVSAQGR